MGVTHAVLRRKTDVLLITLAISSSLPLRLPQSHTIQPSAGKGIPIATSRSCGSSDASHLISRPSPTSEGSIESPYASVCPELPLSAKNSSSSAENLVAIDGSKFNAVNSRAQECRQEEAPASHPEARRTSIAIWTRWMKPTKKNRKRRSSRRRNCSRKSTR